MRRLSIAVLAVLISCQLSAQLTAGADTVAADSTRDLSFFDPATARAYVEEAVRNDTLWRSADEPVKKALGRLLQHIREPFDTARNLLEKSDFRLVKVQQGEQVLTGSTEARWINDSTFAVDLQGWNSELYLKYETGLVYPVDFSTLTLSDSILDENGMLDSTLFIADTVIRAVIDTAAMDALDIDLHNYDGKMVTPPLFDSSGEGTAVLSEDLTQVLYYTPSKTWMAGDDSPFYLLGSEHYLDSLQQAVATLLDFTEKRDSSRLLINDMYGRRIPFWITSGKDEYYRFWVKNFNNDSITLWIGNPGTQEISLQLEDEVQLTRLEKEEINYLPRFMKEPDMNLKKMTMLEPVPIYWDYEFASAFTLNQTYLSNWTKGGESSFSAMMDITGKATYNNKDANTQWINVARLQFGTIMTQEKGFRKNQDQFEIDSKFNRNAWGKIGMSASLYMKHQLAKGYNYPNDSVVISKFLNPGTITVGFGAEYKPIKNTTINVAPLSFKTTFVLDTAHIDQTRHGVDADKRSKSELGAQIVVYNKISPTKGMDIANRIRLFSNYLNKPQNVDVDWEMIVDQKVAWFFTIRLNMHVIYDDDIRFPVLDDSNQPVMNPDGSEKLVPKTQFREFIGLSLQFRF